MVGITGFGTYVPGPDDTTAFMGLEAARKALEMAGRSAAELDVIIWNGAQHKDYINWLAGLYIADQLGAVNAWAFDMEAMCGSMMTGMEVARSLMETNTEYRTVLLVSGYRNGDMISYSVPETSFMFDLGAGGTAVVLERDCGRNALLGTAFKGDGSFSTDCIVKPGGSRNWPITQNDAGKFHFVIDDVQSFKQKLNERTLPNFYAVIEDSLRKSGLTAADIDYLALLHFKYSTHSLILKDLGLSPEQTTYLSDYGHIGQNDQIISLEEGLKAGKIREGTRIVMVGAGLGFVWAAAVVQWGAYSA